MVCDENGDLKLSENGCRVVDEDEMEEMGRCARCIFASCTALLQVYKAVFKIMSSTKHFSKIAKKRADSIRFSNQEISNKRQHSFS